MSDNLTFGELCEAIIQNEDIQVHRYDNKWIDAEFTDDMQLSMIRTGFYVNKYRIKPAPTYKYQWLIKDPGDGFFITANWHTREQAERQFGFLLAEPYLPSERAL